MLYTRAYISNLEDQRKEKFRVSVVLWTLKSKTIEVSETYSNSLFYGPANIDVWPFLYFLRHFICMSPYELKTASWFSNDHFDILMPYLYGENCSPEALLQLDRITFSFSFEITCDFTRLVHTWHLYPIFHVFFLENTYNVYNGNFKISSCKLSAHGPLIFSKMLRKHLGTTSLP